MNAHDLRLESGSQLDISLYALFLCSVISYPIVSYTPQCVRVSDLSSSGTVTARQGLSSELGFRAGPGLVSVLSRGPSLSHPICTSLPPPEQVDNVLARFWKLYGAQAVND